MFKLLYQESQTQFSNLITGMTSNSTGLGKPALSSLDAVSQSIIALTNQKMKSTAPPAPYNGGANIVSGTSTIVEVHQQVNT